MVGTSFQKKVWKEIKKIPYGESRSYKEVALQLVILNPLEQLLMLVPRTRMRLQSRVTE